MELFPGNRPPGRAATQSLRRPRVSFDTKKTEVDTRTYVHAHPEGGARPRGWKGEVGGGSVFLSCE